MVVWAGEKAMSMLLPCTRSAYTPRLMRDMTLPAPSRLASMADRMFAWSSLVTAQNTSVRSMFSSRSRSSSAASPCSTTVWSSSSERRVTTFSLRSMSFTR